MKNIPNFNPSEYLCGGFVAIDKKSDKLAIKEWKSIFSKKIEVFSLNDVRRCEVTIKTKKKKQSKPNVAGAIAGGRYGN